MRCSAIQSANRSLCSSRKCGEDLSRENLMRRATDLKQVPLSLPLPGITLNTTSEDYAPIKQLRLMRFNGTSWDPFGEARMPLICCMRFFIAVLVGCSCKMKPCIFKLAAHRPR
jgi:hypothetical protein